jgi:hypothetical protein
MFLVNFQNSTVASNRPVKPLKEQKNTSGNLLLGGGSGLGELNPTLELDFRGVFRFGVLFLQLLYFHGLLLYLFIYFYPNRVNSKRKL